MTKKDYIAIADIISTTRVRTPDYEIEVIDALNFIEDQFAAYLAGENPLFDEDKFRKACNG